MRKPRSTKHMYVVELVRPPGATDARICTMIRDAVQSEPGQYPPHSPIYNLDRRTVRVKSAGRVLQGITNAANRKGTPT